MNVNDIIPTIDPATIPDRPSVDVIEIMLGLRKKTYSGFAQLEATRGFLLPEVSLSSSKGQEIVRILIMRGIEEVLEFTEANDRAHQLEELIDAWNYFISLTILDPKLDQFQAITGLSEAFTYANFGTTDQQYDVTGPILRVISPFLATLRNRPWQNHAQSLYFDGYPQLLELLYVVTQTLATYFNSWEEFYLYFLAKDDVLQFRLRTRY